MPLKIAITFNDYYTRDELNPEFPTVSCREVSLESDLMLLFACEDYGIKATVFAPGAVAEAYPEAIREVAACFEVAAHGYRHEPLCRPPSQVKQIALRAVEAFRKAGVRVTGWRTPGFSYSPAVPSALRDLGIRWCSDMWLPLALKPRPFPHRGVIEIPTTMLVDYEVFAKRRISPASFARAWLRDLERARRHNSVLVALFHPWLIALSRDRVAMLRALLEEVSALDDAVFLTCSELAGDCTLSLRLTASKALLELYHCKLGEAGRPLELRRALHYRRLQHASFKSPRHPGIL